MAKRTKIRTFIARLYDFVYFGIRYHNGFTKPVAVIGHFRKNEYGALQKKYYTLLRKNGFKRTFFQVIFPGQTAGIIKKIKIESVRELHIRFYKNGKIDCEEEVTRFNLFHFSGKRVNKVEFLEDFLSQCPFREQEKQILLALFDENEHVNEFNREELLLRKEYEKSVSN